MPASPGMGDTLVGEKAPTCLLKQSFSVKANRAGKKTSSEPLAQIDPLALELLQHNGFDFGDVRATHWKEFLGDSAPPLDFVITLSGETAAEMPDEWPPTTVRATWRITDSQPAQGDKAERELALRRALRELETRIKLFALLRHEPADALRAL